MKKFIDNIINICTDFVNSELTKILGISFIPCIIVCLVIIDSICKEASFVPYQMTVQNRENLLHMQQVKCNLVDEVDSYIHKIAPTSCLNGITLVESCDEYDIDVLFVLAQGQIESHYGTRGIAEKTNSVFNVHSFDGVSADEILSSGKGYKHPDYSVDPYLKLLKERYLVDGKTERDMFHKFVDKDGKRYASAENYERQLMNTYLRIDSITDISKLQREYRKYKIITYQ